MGVHAIFSLITCNMNYDPVNLLIYLPVSLLYVVSMAFSFFGMRFIEESISDPIENISGAICSLLCFFILGERLAKGSVIAIVVIVIGILGIGFLENSGETSRKKKIGKTMAAVAFAMPFVYAVLDAFGAGQYLFLHGNLLLHLSAFPAHLLNGSVRLSLRQQRKQ